GHALSDTWHKRTAEAPCGPVASFRSDLCLRFILPFPSTPCCSAIAAQRWPACHQSLATTP
ncbi:hypothetical protein, partial [Chromohalobacter sp. HP20-39]|uniref:hypothetical protein n=1 Tax=Chromohalobacter sp. HP20-39 TaxID=3079306 RepID=UPI00294AE854